MSTPVAMPKQGQSVESCTLLEWMKKKGERVNPGDLLFSYETDKASFELEAPVGGVLLETFFNPQDDVPVHTTVAVIGEPGESIESFRPQGGASVTSAVAEQQTVTVSTPPLALEAPAQTAPAARAAGAEPGAASPRARKKAEERGVDLSAVSGTGPHGRIIERDVLAQAALTKTAAARRSVEGLSAPTEGAGLGGRILAADLFEATAQKGAVRLEDTVTEVKLSNMRRIIGSRMMQSLQQSAQLTMNAFADATALMAYRKQAKARGREGITVTDLIAFAVARTLPMFPELNCIYKDEKLFRYVHVHLAMAVDTPRGLMVPVVRFADRLCLQAMSDTLKELAAQCREGSINPDLLAGGTITITNLGMFGIESFTPILNPPQAAILGVNAIAPRPIQTEEGGYELRPHIGFSLTVDHRIVDGGPGARYLKALCDHIAHIDYMLTIW